MDTSRDMIVDSHSNKSQHHRYHLKLYCFYVCVRNSLSEKQPVVRIIPQKFQFSNDCSIFRKWLHLGVL